MADHGQGTRLMPKGGLFAVESFSRIAVIYNPNSGRPRERASAVRRFATLLEREGRFVEICPTKHPLHATQLAREAVERGCDLVVAHGGDGTMNEVLQSLVGTNATLGFWPGGTANVLAAEIRLPTRLEGVVRHILNGEARTVTVGRANDRYFLLMAGVGMDAAVAAGVDPNLKKRLGKGAFAVSALQFVQNWNPPLMRIETENETIMGRFVVAGNAHSYGGGFRITPQAHLEDPNLDLCVFDSDQLIDYIRFAMAAAVGAHLGLAGVTYRKVQRARITTFGGAPVPVQLDGEVVGGLPLVLDALPGGVRLLV